jgi:hypothetical protein
MTPSWSRPLGASLAHKLPDHRSAAAATTTWGAHLALTAAASKQLNALHQALQAMKGELSVAKDTIADLQAELAVLKAALPGATGASGSSAPTATPSDASGDMTDATPIVDQDQSAEAVVPTKKSGKDVLHVLAACHGGHHSHSSNDGPLLLLAAGARNACEPSILIAGLSNAVLRIPVSGMRLSTSDFNCSSLSSRSGKGVLALAPLVCKQRAPAERGAQHTRQPQPVQPPVQHQLPPQHHQQRGPLLQQQQQQQQQQRGRLLLQQQQQQQQRRVQQQWLWQQQHPHGARPL